MVDLQQCLTLKTPETLERHTHELSYEFLHDLHHEQSTNEKNLYTKNVKICN
jgi:hypothetical protein